MKRGEIYTAATGSGFGSKPRPVLIIQADNVPTLSKKLVVLIGSEVEAAKSIRVTVRPDATNGLRKESHVMVDSILPVRPEKFGRHVGRLTEADMRRVEEGLLLIFGIGATA